jgi:hypothetical protein
MARTRTDADQASRRCAAHHSDNRKVSDLAQEIAEPTRRNVQVSE